MNLKPNTEWKDTLEQDQTDSPQAFFLPKPHMQATDQK